MKYKAFISYKHTELSQHHAAALEKALKRYAKPLLMPPMKIFRDEQIITAGNNLPAKIIDGLNNSEFLIYLGTKEAAVAPWITDELKYWIEKLGRLDRLIIILLDGKIATANNKVIEEECALNKVIIGYLSAEPFYLDLSWSCLAEERDLNHIRYKNIINNLSATLRGITPEEMNGDEIKAHKKNLTLKRVTVTALGILTMATCVAAVYAISKKEVAEIQELSAKSEVLLGEKPQRSSLYALASIGKTMAGLEQKLPSRLKKYYWDVIGNPLPGALKSLQDAMMADTEFDQIIHSESLWSLTASPTGGVILAGDSKGNVVAWLPAAGPDSKKILVKHAHADAVEGIAFSPTNSEIFATASRDGSVKIWNMKGNQIGHKPFEGHKGWVTAIAFSPDGKLIASAGHDGIIMFSDIDGNEIGQELRGHSAFIKQIDFNHDGTRLVSCSGGGEGEKIEKHDNSIRIWNVEERKQIGPPVFVPGLHGAINSAKFSSDSNWIASGDADGNVVIWSVREDKVELHKMYGEHTAPVTTVTFSPDNKYVASGAEKSNWDLSIHISDLQGRRVGYPQRGHSDDITDIAYTDSGKSLISVSLDKTMRIWRSPSYHAIYAKNDDGFVSLAAIPDGGLLTTGFMDQSNNKNSLLQWNIKTGQATALLSSTSGFSAVAANSSGIIATADMLSIYIIGHTGKKTLSLPKDTFVLSVDISENGQQVVAGTFDHKVLYWNLERGIEPTVLVTHPESVFSVKFNPTGTQISSVSGFPDGGIDAKNIGKIIVSELRTPASSNRNELVNVQNNELTYPGMGGQLSSAWLSNTTLVTGGTNGNINVWEGFNLSRSFEGHRESVTSIAINTVGNVIASGSANEGVHLYDAGAGSLLASYKGHKSAVKEMAFSQDGNFLFTAALDGTIMTWNAAINTSVLEACNRVKRRDDFLIAQDEITLLSRKACCLMSTTQKRYEFCSKK